MGFGISNRSYRDKKNEYGGTGQENIFSSKAFKVKSYQIIKYLENKNLWISIESLITKQLIQRLEIVFVDDTSFYLSRDNIKNKIEIIINKYTTLHKAIGRLIKKDKNYYYTLQ